jgi:hypothetical protein
LLLVYNTIDAQQSVKITYDKNFYSDAFFSQIPLVLAKNLKQPLKTKTFRLINNGDNSLFQSTEIVIQPTGVNSEDL